MRPDCLEFLACPDCLGSLALGDEPQERGTDGHVMTGRLECRECRRELPIRGGVPRLLPESLHRSDLREDTATRFGYEWNRFSQFDATEEAASMATWLRPRSLADLKDLTVLDVGCGMGRHAVIAADAGVRRLVGIDLGHAVDAAFANTRHLAEVTIVQADIYHPPLADGMFDAAFSLGVLHHLPDPKRGFVTIAPKLRPGGWFHLWLYGREGNAWIVHFVNGIRRMTSRMPLGLLYFLSAALAVPLFIAAKTLYRLPGLRTALPYHPYIAWLGRFGFKKIHAIVFDHALTPVAHYLSREQVDDLVSLDGWTVVDLEHSRGMSWGITVRAPGHSQ
ncbi:MAG: methyltransferase domain-containing protein, partial [bacterium]|nr:methyltransferase domain-containing protein [bacterium]